MSPNEYQNTPDEQKRVADLMDLLPQGLDTVLDVGARDGFISKRLADRARRVTALDLELPQIDDPRITCESPALGATQLLAGSQLGAGSRQRQHQAPHLIARRRNDATGPKGKRARLLSRARTRIPFWSGTCLHIAGSQPGQDRQL